MTKKQIQTLQNEIIRWIPDLVSHASMLLLPPTTQLLRGIHFEGSSFDKTSFSMTVFAMPLCVPATYISLNVGNRLLDSRKRDRWDNTMPALIEEVKGAIVNQAVPFMSRAATLDGFVNLANDYPGNPHTAKAIAFCFVRLRRADLALRVIDEYLPSLDRRMPWQNDIFERSQELQHQLRVNPEEAFEQLMLWEDSTREALHVPRLIADSS